DGGSAPRLGRNRRGEEPSRDCRERQRRLALGAAHRRLRTRDRSSGAQEVMAAVGTAEAGVRARGVSRPWRLLSAAFFVGAILVGLGVGPVGIGAVGIVESALSHVPLLHVPSPLSSLDEAVLWQIRA